MASDLFGSAAAKARSLVTETSIPLLGLQVLGVLAALVGISFWSIPCALVVGGIAAIISVELQHAPGVETESEMDERNRLTRAQVDAAIKAGKDPFDSGACPLTPLWVGYVELMTRSRVIAGSKA